jgi:hypothetical protein
VPRAWTQGRRLGTARLTGTFCDIGHSASLALLRSSLANRLVHYGLEDLDAGDEIDNSAIFEPAQVREHVTEMIAPDDPDLLAVAERFGLMFT